MRGPDITIVHARGARSTRVIWLCEELGLPYKLIEVNLVKRKPPEHLELSPLGLVPAIRDGPLVLSESGAIVQYLLRTYAHGRLQPPPDTPAAHLMLQWCWFAEASLTHMLSEIAIHTRLASEKYRIPQIVPYQTARAQKRLAYLEKELQGKDFILGAGFTAADIMLGTTLKIAQGSGMLDAEQHANLLAYLGRLQQRPAFQTAFPPGAGLSRL